MAQFYVVPVVLCSGMHRPILALKCRHEICLAKIIGCRPRVWPESVVSGRASTLGGVYRRPPDLTPRLTQTTAMGALSKLGAEVDFGSTITSLALPGDRNVSFALTSAAMKPLLRWRLRLYVILRLRLSARWIHAWCRRCSPAWSMASSLAPQALREVLDATISAFSLSAATRKALAYNAVAVSLGVVVAWLCAHTRRRMRARCNTVHPDIGLAAQLYASDLGGGSTSMGATASSQTSLTEAARDTDVAHLPLQSPQVGMQFMRVGVGNGMGSTTRVDCDVAGHSAASQCPRRRSSATTLAPTSITKPASWTCITSAFYMILHASSPTI